MFLIIETKLHQFSKFLFIVWQEERDRHMTGYYSVMIAPPMLLYILSFASEREEVGKKNF